MVNEMKHIKIEVLKILYTAHGKTVSGVTLSDNLKISRVAIWKHITGLKEMGFEVESKPKGYFLNNWEDLLLPFCFNKKYQNRIHHFQELETTMDKAKSLAKEGIEHLSVVIAENQSIGRGRMNRKWFSDKGGLWFTLILKPQIPPMLSYLYNFAASLTLSRVINKLFNLDVKVKWPNDLLLDGKKLTGLLSEMETRGDMVEFINIGIGINVNNNPQVYEPKAISLKDVLKRNVSRKKILESFLMEFEDQIQDLNPDKIISQWKEMTATIGSQVRIETLGDLFEGLALDVDESGALMIQTNNNEIKKIIYGDCFHT